MVEIIWNPLVKSEHQREIEKYLNPYLFLVPKWCQKILISVYATDDNANIKTGVNYDYRNAWMEFYSAWLLESDSKKQMDVIHDLLHISTSVYVDYAESQINLLCPENEAEKFHKSLLEESRIRCESMVQDLAYSIYQKFELLK